MICNGCLFNLEIFCLIFFVVIKKMPYYFLHTYLQIGMILLNDIMGWINIYELLVELTFVVHLKIHFLVF
jgi:hypothetical protein